MDNSGFISFYCLKLPALEYSLTAPIVLLLNVIITLGYVQKLALKVVYGGAMKTSPGHYTFLQ